jgi:DNA gyrase subunit A
VEEGRRREPGTDDAARDSEEELLHARARHRLEIVEALSRAIELGWPLIEAIEGARDWAGAVQRLQGRPFEFTDVQAHHILDLTHARRTVQARTNLTDEAAELRTLLGTES